MNPQKVINFLETECVWKNNELRNLKTNRRIKAILPVHILGHPVNMKPILEISRKYNLVIIEDSTESLGAKYKDYNVGCLGDIGCFSFNGNKMITTGGGGMIVTDNEKWADRARYLTTQAKDDPVEYIHNEIGYNYRLTNLQAAMGCAQMEKLEEYISIKRQIASVYNVELSKLHGVIPMQEASWAFHACWMYTVLIDDKIYGIDNRKLMNNLKNNGIETRVLWQPLHMSPVYKNCQSIGGEVAKHLNRQALSLPCSVGLTEKQQHKVIESIKSFCKES
jgi:dTDP-4-amino-4,6-dideoxygalactose transaminase